MSKQDRVYTRTAADLERKQNVRKSFSEVMGVVNETRGIAEEAKEEATNPADNMTSDEVFNLLTKNGTLHGLYRGDDGELYINASYIKSGEIKTVTLWADSLKLVPDDAPYGRYIFSSYAELNAFVEDSAQAMDLNTQKTIGAVLDFELFGYGTITFAMGLNGNGEPNILVTLLVCGQHLYRMATSDSYGEDVARSWYWHNAEGGDDEGEWSPIGVSNLSEYERITAERYNGKPVYTKLVDLGVLPNKSSISVPFSTESCTVVSFEAYATRTSDNYMRSLPFFNNSGGCEAVVSINHANKAVEVKTLYDYSGYTGKAILKYIKDEAVI